MYNKVRDWIVTLSVRMIGPGLSLYLVTWVLAEIQMLSQAISHIPHTLSLGDCGGVRIV